MQTFKIANLVIPQIIFRCRNNYQKLKMFKNLTIFTIVLILQKMTVSTDVSCNKIMKTMCELNFGISVPTDDQCDNGQVATSCGGEKNLAFRKPTNQSSTYPAFGVYSQTHSWSRNAVDGVLNADWYVGGSCIHTLKEKNPWWQVDLEKDFPISKVLVLNRGKTANGTQDDNRGALLKNMKVTVTSEAGTATEFGFFKGPGSDAEIIELNKAVPVRGRYVKVQLMTTEYLHICEVEVIGTQC